MSNTVLLTIEDVLAYMGIDYADEIVNKNITRAINTANAYLKGSIGANYPREDPRVKELALIIVSDLYDIRGYTVSASMSNNVRRLVDDMSLQLRLELSDDGSTSGNFNYPYIDSSGNWFIWDIATEKYIDSGVSALGYVPKKGVDYWTESDIAEIKKYVDSAILGGAW